MKFAVRKLRPADADALKAAAWYDEQQPGLGDAFFDDVDAAIAALAENPLIYSVRFADVRCVRLRRFPDMESSISSLARKCGCWPSITGHATPAGCGNGGASLADNF
ncbi:MAG TPA: hypothetical protein VNN22_12920 [Verrucomicrobiae bacterium]|nr:hypothetical protein [Verrucomicrobiae bacterium]